MRRARPSVPVGTDVRRVRTFLFAAFSCVRDSDRGRLESTVSRRQVTDPLMLRSPMGQAVRVRTIVAWIILRPRGRRAERLWCAVVAERVLSTTRVEREDVVIDLAPPWTRLSLRQAILEQSGIDYEAFENVDDLRTAARKAGLPAASDWNRAKLIDELLTVFVEPKLIQPTFLIGYPVELSPLAKRNPDRPNEVERFEGFIGGMEVANAFSELNDPIDQAARFQEQAEMRAAGDDEAQLLDQDFLEALEYGMPPTGGLGIGIDRLVMILTGRHSIREVVLFPQLRTRL